MASSAQVQAVGPEFAFPLDVRSIEAGLPIEALTSFLQSSGLAAKDIYDIVIPARTLKHRRARAENLSQDESDKLARLFRIYRQAVKVFGNETKAHWWLREPHLDLQKRTPFQYIRTELGARLVEELLIQIDEGMFA